MLGPSLRMKKKMREPPSAGNTGREQRTHFEGNKGYIWSH